MPWTLPRASVAPTCPCTCLHDLESERASSCGSPGRQAPRAPSALGVEQDPAPRKFTRGLEEEPDSPVVSRPNREWGKRELGISGPGPSALDAGEPGQLSARPARGLTEAEWGLGQGPEVELPRTMRPCRVLVYNAAEAELQGP